MAFLFVCISLVPLAGIDGDEVLPSGATLQKKFRRMRNRLYYYLKPYLPYGLKTTLRRKLAQHLRKRHTADWPILPAAAQRPMSWKGWPDGRQFAFVLTHDVESQVGVEQVQRLAELEMAEGVRSSFNFVPEGDYQVPEKLREWLMERGFEVGVHDLHHDGHLYRSKTDFLHNAERINRHIQNWGAKGFRSAFMLHRLDWLSQLDIEYDASTFDTDPFEPQPDGARTIYPFVHQPKNHGRPFVELPYTLPQDSTLFILFQEKTPATWNMKMDWIAQSGGMCLVNVHPDYIAFDKSHGSLDYQYPEDIYRSFLKHFKRQHAAKAWHPLPIQVARHLQLGTPRETGVKVNS